MCINRIEKYKRSVFYRKTRELTGRVLEIGFGRGESLRTYASAELVCAAEVSMDKTFNAAERMKKGSRNAVKIICGSAMHLPFADNTFDTVVTMFAVCSFADPGLALSEIRRVLKPDGRYLALEHTVSLGRGIRIVQNLLSRPVHYFTGCNLKSDPVKQMTGSGFRVLSSEYIPFFYEPTLMIEATPK